MKRGMKIISTVFLLGSLLTGSGFAEEGVKAVDWQAYGKNLTAALRSDNTGLQRSALQTIILKGDKIVLGNGIHDLMNVYLLHEDVGFRQLALVALHKTKNDWAMNYLRSRYNSEKSPKLKKLMAVILNDYFGERT